MSTEAQNGNFAKPLLADRFINSLWLSDNIALIKQLPDNSVDAIITDSPYGLGKEPDPLKVIPAWLEHGYYEVKGKGFMGKHWDAFVPQPLLWKECFRVLKPGGYLLSFFGTRTYDWGTIAIRFAGFEIRDCIQWIYGSGFPKGKAQLKPANEPICVARKPGPIHPINIDDCRIELNGDAKGGVANRIKGIGDFNNGELFSSQRRAIHDNSVGRYPSNVMIDDSVAKLIDEQSGFSGGDRRRAKKQTGKNGVFTTQKKGMETPCYNDFGGASRFFYVAKASPTERKYNAHPTVKPVSLMIQLVKLYSPINGIVLDPHAGSGTTGEACIITSRKYILIDNDQFSYDISKSRLDKKKGLFK